MPFSPLALRKPETESKLSWRVFLALKLILTSLLTGNLTLKTAQGYDLPADWAMIKSNCFSSASCQYDGGQPAKIIQQFDSNKAIVGQIDWGFRLSANIDLNEVRNATRSSIEVRFADLWQPHWNTFECWICSVWKASLSQMTELQAGCKKTQNWIADLPFFKHEQSEPTFPIVAEVSSDEELRIQAIAMEYELWSRLVKVYDHLIRRDWIQPQRLMTEVSSYMTASERALELFQARMMDALAHWTGTIQRTMLSHSERPYFTTPQFIFYEDTGGNRFVFPIEIAARWGLILH